MKSKKSKEEAATPSAKGKVKIKTLKLTKETIENLSDQDAGAVKGGNGSRLNGGAQRWVARAVYGEANPRWTLFRAWLTEDSPRWFHALYLRHGERFALWLAPHSGLKSVIRLWMDSRIDRKNCAVTQLA